MLIQWNLIHKTYEEKNISNLDSLEILNVDVPLTKKRKVVYSDFNEFYFFPKCLRLDFSNHIGSQVLSVLCLRPEKKEQGLLTTLSPKLM